MQVVELYVVVQNMSQARVRLTDQISVAPIGMSSSAPGSEFQPFTSESSAHLTPHMLSFNEKVCATKEIKSVVLNHGDLCVLDVFLHCPGLDLEQEFLQRCERSFPLDVVSPDVLLLYLTLCAFGMYVFVFSSAAWLHVECTSESPGHGGALESVAVRAQCLDEAQRKHVIDTNYSSLDVIE